MTPSHRLESKGVKEVRAKTTGAEKKCVTVVLACTAAGNTTGFCEVLATSVKNGSD